MVLSVQLTEGVLTVTVNATQMFFPSSGAMDENDWTKATQIFSTSNAVSENAWTQLVITFQNTTSEAGITAENSIAVDFFVNGTNSDNQSLSIDFPTMVSSVELGSEYSGALQDVGLYLPSLISDVLDPETADFLPQCLCYPEDIYSADPSLCDSGSVQQNR